MQGEGLSVIIEKTVFQTNHLMKPTALERPSESTNHLGSRFSVKRASNSFER